MQVQEASLSVVDALKVLDSLAVAGVLGLMLKWALKRIEEKDAQIVDLANRAAGALERALEREERGDR
ncbi:MAG: hypothetical protein GWN53_08720 [Gammaproteobacteria bacterium]|nr:hypothetical protein [Gammaproteobacteria bacterium]